MVNDYISQFSPQSPLFKIEQSVGQIELFPTIWSAAENLLSQDRNEREEGLRCLTELDAARYSPLIAYLMITRLNDPDTAVRAGIVQALSDILSPGRDGKPTPEESYSLLCHYLAEMRTRQVYALLQVLDYDISTVRHVDRLLNLCPYAGNHLAKILVDKRLSLSIRKQAVEAIGRVGFLDTLPVLERLEARLETRQNGQGSMPFAPAAYNGEMELLPAIKGALACLRAP
jgi:hypothetical protein